MPPRKIGPGPGVRRRDAEGAVPAAAALQRLQEAFQVFQRTRQGEGENLEQSARAVTADELIQHPSADVRLWVAKCLAEVLMIFVPAPPIESERMPRVLELLISQLAWLRDSSAPNYQHALHLLDRLAEVRCFMLLFDCPDPVRLLCALVTTCLDVVRQAKDDQVLVESTLAQVLGSILGEADELPKAVLKELVEELVPRNGPNAAGLVRLVLKHLAHRSAAVPVNDFLTQSLIEATQDDLAMPLTAAQRGDALEQVLCSIYEVYVVEPALVARVLPHLQEDLLSADIDRRRSVTALVGELLAHCPGESSGSVAGRRELLVCSNPLLVDRHRDRLSDADDGVRLAALDGAAALLQTAVSVTEQPCFQSLVVAAESYVAKLAERSLDPNETIRARVVEVVTRTGSSGSGLRLVQEVLPEVCRRVVDKKAVVREACAEAMAKLYARHALPRWISGQGAGDLAWLPQQLCEAYLTFSRGRLGHIAQLEEHIEQHVLGCGAKMEVSQRALAMLGFVSSVLRGQEAAVQGLHLLLARKADANAALLAFVSQRSKHASPLLADAAKGALVPFASEAPVPDEARKLFDRLARHSPTFEERSSAHELLPQLAAMNAVRDKSLWTHLGLLLDPCIDESTEGLWDPLAELDRLLRIHDLGTLTPLVRRALLCTWLLPDQVQTLVELWNGTQDLPEGLGLAELRRSLAQLPKYFTGAFLPQAEALMELLGQPAEATAALKALAGIAKRGQAMDFPATLEDVEGKCFLLLSAIEAAEDCGSACRKAVRTLWLFPDAQRLPLARLLLLASGQCFEMGKQITALNLAAALYEQDFPGSKLFRHLEQRDDWLERGRHFLAGPEAPERCCAAVELLTSAGSSEDILRALSASSTALVPAEREDRPGEEWCDPLPLHGVCFSLRALRSGRIAVSTRLLAQLAAKMDACLSSRATGDADRLVKLLQSLQKPVSARLRFPDRLRLFSTLPLMFAFAPLKRHRDIMQRMLQTTLVKAFHDNQEPVLDYCIACFIHFLSNLELFQFEASAAASAFQRSSKLCSFLCDALLRHDMAHIKGEFASVTLQVCDRVRYFVDRERPDADLVQKASSVLRYVVEKQWPGWAESGGPGRGSMPAELFCVREGLTPGPEDQALTTANQEVLVTPKGKRSAPPLVTSVARPMGTVGTDMGGSGEGGSGNGHVSGLSGGSGLGKLPITALAVPPAWSKVSLKRPRKS
ncbi:unnamed protein product [Effrenium voratum]|nr:unnamed protein product [Effrenium voratum]